MVKVLRLFITLSSRTRASHSIPFARAANQAMQNWPKLDACSSFYMTNFAAHALIKDVNRWYLPQQRTHLLKVY